MSSYVQRRPPVAPLGRRLSAPAQSLHRPPIPRFHLAAQSSASPSSPCDGTQLLLKSAGCGPRVTKGKAAPGLEQQQERTSTKVHLHCDAAVPNNTCNGGGGDGIAGGGGDGGGRSRRRGYGFGASGGDGDGDGDGSGGGGQQGSDPQPHQPLHTAAQGAVHKLLVAATATAVGVSLTSSSPALAADSSTGEAKAVAEAAAAAAGGGAPAASIASVLGAAAGVATTDGGGGGDMTRVKRLLREVFGELTELRVRLDGMDAAAAAAAAAAEDALVVPLEGLAVRPYSRALAAGMRLRSRAQVSGWVDAPALLPLLAAEQQRQQQPHHHHPTTSGDPQGPHQQHQQHADAGGDAPSCSSSPSSLSSGDVWADMMASGNLAGAPRLRLRVQSLWGAGGSSAAAAAASPSPSPPPPASAVSAGAAQSQAGRRQGQGPEEEESRPVAAHLQLATAPDGRSVVLDKLLLKAEAHPRLRLMLASHGSLQNIGMNVNPFAGAGELQRGLSAATRKGHDLELLSQGGAGAAAAAKTGNVSAAVGAFTTGGPMGPSGAGELPTAACPASATASAAGGGTTTTCAQFSLHRFQRFVLTAAWAASSPSCPAASSYQSLPSPSPLPSRPRPPSSPPSPPSAAAAAVAAVPEEPGSVTARGGLVGRGAAGCATASAAASCSGGVDGGNVGSCRQVQRGLIGAMQLGERLSAAVWIGDSVWTPLEEQGGGGRAGRGEGAESDTDSGCGPLGPWTEAQPACEDRPRRRQHRVGVRLARLPDEDTGRSYVLSVSHRRTVAGGDGTAAGRGEGTRLLVAEASAALPLANGVVVTPGVVLVRRSDGHTVRTLLSAAAQTTWMF